MGLCKFHFADEMDFGWPALTSRAIELGTVVVELDSWESFGDITMLVTVHGK